MRARLELIPRVGGRGGSSGPPAGMALRENEKKERRKKGGRNEKKEIRKAGERENCPLDAFGSNNLNEL